MARLPVNFATENKQIRYMAKKETSKKGAALDPRTAKLSALNQALERIEKDFGK